MCRVVNLGWAGLGWAELVFFSFLQVTLSSESGFCSLDQAEEMKSPRFVKKTNKQASKQRKGRINERMDKQRKGRTNKQTNKGMEYNTIRLGGLYFRDSKSALAVAQQRVRHDTAQHNITFDNIT